MASRLNERDLELIQTNKTIDLTSKQYGYIGGEFTKNTNDYVEVLIYDVNENLIESGIVDSSDYLYDSDTGIKLNSGTILRKMGYDRGRYIVKYNFLRKVAGSYETVLIDNNGALWDGPYHQMANGTIMSGAEHSSASKTLFLKDYSYFIHQISDSRSEVRLVPQLINDFKYLGDFLDAQKQEKPVYIKSTLNFVADNTADKGDSLTLEAAEDGVFTKKMENGVLVLDNAYIESYLPDPTETWGESPTGEIESDTVQARFIISADTGLGSDYRGGDRNWSKLFEIMKDVTLDVVGIPEAVENITAKTNSEGVNALDRIIIGSGYRVNYGQSDSGLTPTIRLKSVSSKPNVATTYTWELTGHDYDSSGKHDGLLAPATAANDYNTGDVEITSPETDTNSLLKVVDKDKLDGSEIEFKIYSSNCFIGIKLTIESKEETSSIWYPAGAIFTTKA